METPPDQINESYATQSSTLPNTPGNSYSHSVSPEALMSRPQEAQPSLDGSPLNRKFAARVASLYDPVEKPDLSSPLFKPDSVRVKPLTDVIDLCTPEFTSAASSSSDAAPIRLTDSEITDLSLSDTDSKDGLEIDEKLPVINPVRSQWVGTSQFFVEKNVEWQQDGTLKFLISYLKDIEHDLSQYPYDPSAYLDYAGLVNKIGFTDIGAAAAHRALILIEDFLNKVPEIYAQVQKAIIARLQPRPTGPFSPNIIEDEAQTLHLHAYRHLLNGLLGCACFWEGLKVAKKALEKWPNDHELLESRQWLKEGFNDRHTGLKDLAADAEDLVILARMGKIYQKPYPWIPTALYKRKPALVREVNKKFGAQNCEVRPAVFSPPETYLPPQLRMKSEENQDVGPLGVFATRNIKEGELVMVDQCLTAVSNISPTKFEHCEACHATLKASPLFQVKDIIKPVCCNAVAYCSRACFLKALSPNSYHKVLCSKDFSWLYDATGSEVSGGAGYKWRKVMFLRIMAIIIADRRQEILQGKKPTHPLQHHLVARMAANYAFPDKLHPTAPNDWQYNENIIAPTKILMMLGINIFTDRDFSQDVIQTIYWRIENNANMSIIDHAYPKAQTPTSIPTDSKNKAAVYMVRLSPQYLFFNHSCEPKISWHGAIPNPYVGRDWISGYSGQIMKVGSSVVFCKASQDIKAGEELKISYVGNPMGKGVEESECRGAGGREEKRRWLEKWFEGGCGCELCEREIMDRERESVTSTDGGERTDLDLVAKLEGQI